MALEESYFVLPVTGGYNPSDDPLLLPPGTARDMANVRFESGILQSRAGSLRLKLLDTAAVECDGLACYEDVLGILRLVAVASGDIWESPDNGATWAKAAEDVFTPGRDVTFTVVGSNLIATDGLEIQRRDWQAGDLPGVWSHLGIDKPDNPPVLADGGAGVLSGDYEYMYTCENAVETSDWSDIATITVAAKQVSVTLPAGPAGTLLRKLYRRGGGIVTEFELVTTVSNNTDNVVVTDNTADADLGAFAAENPQGHSPFPGATCLSTHLTSRMVGVKDDEVYVSSLAQPGYCPLVNLTDEYGMFADATEGRRFTVSPEHGMLTACRSFGPYTVLFSKTRMLLFSGDEPATFQIRPAYAIGCVGAHAACVADSTLYWVSSKGVYAWDGQNAPKRLSWEVRAILDTVPESQRAGMHLTARLNELVLTWGDGSVALYYSLVREGWGRIEGWKVRRTACFPQRTGAEEVLVGTETPGEARVARTQLWQLEVGVADDGAAIPWRWNSGSMDLSLPDRDKRILRVEAEGPATSGKVVARISFEDGGTDVYSIYLEPDPKRGIDPGETIRFKEQSSPALRGNYLRVDLAGTPGLTPQRLRRLGLAVLPGRTS